MKICISTILLFLLSFSSAWSLPECPGSPYTGEYSVLTSSWHNCEGTLIHTDKGFEGDKYVGEFKDGKYNGQGTATFASGDKYVGEFKDGKRYGQGTFTWADGRIQEGQWRNNKYVGKKEYEDKALKLEEVEELYKDKLITDEERKKMRNKILGID